MKKTTLLSAVAATIASLGLFATSAKALTYTDGDLLLGFYATGGTGASDSYVVNLGQVSTYLDLSAGEQILLSIGNIGLDLTAKYGSDWHSRADVKWTVFGAAYNAEVGSDPFNTIYLGRAQNTLGTSPVAYSRESDDTQANRAAGINDTGELYAAGSETANSSVATFQANSDSRAFGGSTSQAASATYGFTGALGSFVSGTANSRVDLFSIEPRVGSTPALSTYEGSFSINNGGAVVFANGANLSPNFTPVPEPSVYGAATVLALAAFVIARRRRAAAQA